MKDMYSSLYVLLMLPFYSRADLDPIYYCELLKVCAVNDQSDVKITKLAVSPTSGPVGTKFQVIYLV